MKTIAMSTITLMIINIGIEAEILTVAPTNESNVSTEQHTPIQVSTVRNILGANDPILHTRGQLRAGYIGFNSEGNPSSNAYGLGGHIHFDTKRWHGWQVGVSVYVSSFTTSRSLSDSCLIGCELTLHRLHTYYAKLSK